MIDSKRIAKNTLFMYIRMFIILGVSLYTSRVVLDKLGVDDYGLYNVVAGLVGMLSFLNGTLSTGTSRFLMYDLGVGDTNKLKSTFNTVLITHVALACFIILIGETLGVWYINNILIVDHNRLLAIRVVFQLSILTAVISVIQVPFTSVIMAHEKMSFYAYLSIFEAIAKLLIVYILSIVTADKLIVYAFLIVLVSVLIFIVYAIYCYSKFDEVRFTFFFDKETSKSLLSFSGWNLLANLSNTLGLQGVLVLQNLFFQPFVAASQAISNQISSAIMQFINNVRVAINPQIIKLYADNKFEESKRLTLWSAQIMFDLLLLIGLPCIIVMDKLIDLWLVEIPDYAIIFAQYAVLRNILDNFNYALYLPMIAANKIKKNSLAALFLGVGQFILLYIVFKLGASALWSSYLALGTTVLFSFIVKPYILYKDVNYRIKELFECYWGAIKVLILSSVLSFTAYALIGNDTFLKNIVIVIITIVSVIFSSYITLGREKKKYLMSFANDKIKLLK